MKRALVAGVAAVIALAGCQQARQAADSAQAQATPAAGMAAELPPDVALAVDLARAVEANPAAADSILAAHQLTRAGLDSLMFAIAADSAKAAAYSAALR